MDVTIYHNPSCVTSRNTLAMIRNAGVEPRIIEYKQNPLTPEAWKELISQAGLTMRQALRERATLYAELGLDDPALSDKQLFAAMMAHPTRLINRPFVVTPVGVQLCRPCERVLDILPLPQLGMFVKEDGEMLINAAGARVTKPD